MEYSMGVTAPLQQIAAKKNSFFFTPNEMQVARRPSAPLAVPRPGGWAPRRRWENAGVGGVCDWVGFCADRVVWSAGIGQGVQGSRDGWKVRGQWA